MPKLKPAALAAICFLAALAIWPDETLFAAGFAAVTLLPLALILRLMVRIERVDGRAVLHVRWPVAFGTAAIVVLYVSERLHHGW